MATIVRRLVLGLLVCGLLHGCVTTTWTKHHARESRIVSEDQVSAYARSTKAIHALGWQVMGANSRAGVGVLVLAARVNKAVTVQVLFSRQGTGTLLDVQVIAEAGYVLPRDVHEETKAFLVAYAQESR